MSDVTVSGIVAAVLAAAVVVMALGRRRRTARHSADRPATAFRTRSGAVRGAVDAPPNHVPTGEIPLVRRDRTLLADPPTIDGYTLRDWLVHHTHRDGVWEQVVVEFYRRAAAEPRVAAYFAGSDLPRLQRHFLAALTVLTHSGLHRNTLERMAVAHRGVTTPDGRPVTGEVWDLVVATLVAVLRNHGVPAAAIEPLGALLDPLRAVIVAEPTPPAGRT